MTYQYILTILSEYKIPEYSGMVVGIGATAFPVKILHQDLLFFLLLLHLRLELAW
jgi:hypothetical protein